MSSPHPVIPMDILEYSLVALTDIEEFEQKVNRLLKEGFQPLGPVNCCVSDEFGFMWSQGMARYAEVSK